jgi:hypothetical protein
MRVGLRSQESVIEEKKLLKTDRIGKCGEEVSRI